MTMSPSTMPAITFRPITAEDEPFLYQLYASTRQEELALTDWSEEQKQSFLKMQFSAQHQYYQEHYEDTTFDLILVDGCAAGRLYVARWPEEIRIVDIALLPEWRKRGIGSGLIEALLQEGAERNLPVRIHVECFNPALRLYYRLGFRKIEDKGVYHLLQWKADPE
jgi:ribosomal protein S18 acetylase RimI-like enzyme